MKRFNFKPLLWILLTICVIVGTAFAAWYFLLRDDRQAEALPDTKIATAEEAPQPTLPDFIDLQPTVEEWLNTSAHGKVALMIYDFDHSQVAAAYNADTQMLPASLYKLFYAYDGYLQISNGTDDPDEAYLGDLTLGECLDLMIRESNNPCGEAMLDDPARASRVAALIREQGMAQTIPTALMTSASDVMKLLQLYYVHDGWTDTAWEKFLDSALNQPPASAGDFRQGLPSGFSAAQVYNKVGWSAVGGGWDIYNDAALVVFPESTASDSTPLAARHYGMVVLTRSTSHLVIADLGEMIEQAILAPAAAGATGDTLIEASE